MGICLLLLVSLENRPSCSLVVEISRVMYFPNQYLYISSYLMQTIPCVLVWTYFILLFCCSASLIWCSHVVFELRLTVLVYKHIKLCNPFWCLCTLPSFMIYHNFWEPFWNHHSFISSYLFGARPSGLVLWNVKTGQIEILSPSSQLSSKGLETWAYYL